MSIKDMERSKKSKNKNLSLETRMTLLVGAVVLVSILIAFGIAKGLELLFPFTTKIPLLIQPDVEPHLIERVDVVVLNYMK